MKFFKNIWLLFNNYFLSLVIGKLSTTTFWYLPEPPNVFNKQSLQKYKKPALGVPFYLMDYCGKLKYKYQNQQGIIVLPYNQPIGAQVNPEAAFQYALGLHDQYLKTRKVKWFNKFWHYVDYFVSIQTKDGDWHYNFDWFASKAPWSSALAQARGASVMLRAWMHSGKEIYLDAARRALSKFDMPTSQGGFLEKFSLENCFYFEEYPKDPTAVINGFMAALFGVWELSIWTQDARLTQLWKKGISSLEKMLPHYTLSWWTLYDLNNKTWISNINSSRYHLLEINYMKVLCTLDDSAILKKYQLLWLSQYTLIARAKAFFLKVLRKILYR